MVFIIIPLLVGCMDKEVDKIIDKVIHNEGGYNNDALDMAEKQSMVLPNDSIRT